VIIDLYACLVFRLSVCISWITCRNVTQLTYAYRETECCCTFFFFRCWHLVSAPGCGQLDTRSTRHMCRVDSFTKKSTRHKSTRHRSQLDTRSTRHASKFQSNLTAAQHYAQGEKSEQFAPTVSAPTEQSFCSKPLNIDSNMFNSNSDQYRAINDGTRSMSRRHMHVI